MVGQCRVDGWSGQKMGLHGLIYSIGPWQPWNLIEGRGLREGHCRGETGEGALGNRGDMNYPRARTSVRTVCKKRDGRSDRRSSYSIA